MTAAC